MDSKNIDDLPRPKLPKSCQVGDWTWSEVFNGVPHKKISSAMELILEIPAATDTYRFISFNYHRNNQQYVGFVRVE